MTISNPTYWIYRIECDFCNDREVDLFHVDQSGTPEFWTACMKCIELKGWKQ